MTTPISAANLNNNVSFSAKPKNTVVCPPDQFYKYSVYDELDLGRDRFKEIMGALKEDPAGVKAPKDKNVGWKIVKWALFAGVCALAYVKRASIGKFISESYDKIKETFKK